MSEEVAQSLALITGDLPSTDNVAQSIYSVVVTQETGEQKVAQSLAKIIGDLPSNYNVAQSVYMVVCKPSQRRNQTIVIVAN